jgi:hypothetical protein
MWSLAMNGGLIIGTIFQPDSGGLRCALYEILATSRRILVQYFSPSDPPRSPHFAPQRPARDRPRA